MARRPRRRGFSLLEVVVATLVMAAMALPLFQLLEGGLRGTRATIHEIRGTHLAAELAEQVDTLPFAVVEDLVPLAGSRNLESLSGEREGELVDQSPIGDSAFRFHLTPLPRNYQRSLLLTRPEADLVLAEARVHWEAGSLPAGTVRLRRALVRDSLLP